MAESGQERTEQASPKRLEDARKRGQFARSVELPGAAALLFGALVLRLFGPTLWSNLTTLLRHDLAQISRTDLTARDAVNLLGQSIWDAALAVAPILALIGATGVGVGLLQSGFNLSLKALAPKPERLNPMQGLKRLASGPTFFEMAKMIFRLAIMGWVAFSVVSGLTAELAALAAGGIADAPAVLGDMAQTLIVRVALASGVLALADYGYQRWHFTRELRMTRQEVRDEQRQMDGDPQIKARIRRLQRQRAKNRMLKEVPQATMVLANPTHYAVALRYQSGKNRAPLVVAKGQDLVAQQIKELARTHNVPVLEQPALARALFAAVPLGREIPVQFYRAIAELIALIYQMKRKW